MRRTDWNRRQMWNWLFFLLPPNSHYANNPYATWYEANTRTAWWLTCYSKIWPLWQCEICPDFKAVLLWKSWGTVCAPSETSTPGRCSGNACQRSQAWPRAACRKSVGSIKSAVSTFHPGNTSPGGISISPFFADTYSIFSLNLYNSVDWRLETLSHLSPF